MNKRLDPNNRHLHDRTWVDMGDKAATCHFSADATHFGVGQGNKGEAHLLLKEISRTGDDKWRGDYDNSDGGPSQAAGSAER